jgi:hypothetical protein
VVFIFYYQNRCSLSLCLWLLHLFGFLYIFCICLKTLNVLSQHQFLTWPLGSQTLP